MMMFKSENFLFLDPAVQSYQIRSSLLDCIILFFCLSMKPEGDHEISCCRNKQFHQQFSSPGEASPTWSDCTKGGPDPRIK